MGPGSRRKRRQRRANAAQWHMQVEEDQQEASLDTQRQRELHFTCVNQATLSLNSILERVQEFCSSMGPMDSVVQVAAATQQTRAQLSRWSWRWRPQTQHNASWSSVRVCCSTTSSRRAPCLSWRWQPALGCCGPAAAPAVAAASGAPVTGPANATVSESSHCSSSSRSGSSVPLQHRVVLRPRRGLFC